MASLPNTRVPSVEEALGITEIARILGVHPRTIERRRGARTPSRPLEAQREEKLDRIWHELTALFSPENAIVWLKCPLPVLENRRPIEVMAEDGGLDRVLGVIGRMSWGIPA
ncbi:MAG TPA: antitoxin Xre/MbcA/ParS toxin-binding domain-containing protein [Bryobacteraceae bacterium]|nr:antitoxin Xre/MbcA/ParS toxin-binding domain-containing protein [Bryobacteraceae bacterium]